MSSIVKRLIAAGQHIVTLPDSGLEVKILRAQVYSFMRLHVPLGSLLQGMSGAIWHIGKGQKLPDKLAAQINAASPSFSELAERLFCECVYQMREPEDEWVRVRVVPNDEATDEDEDKIAVGKFCRGFTLTDLTTLQNAIWDHNGLGKGVEALLRPFREVGRPDAPPDGEELRQAPDGASRDGPVPVPGERGDHGGGGGSGAEGDAGSTGASVQ